jgi:putative DNA primase/helicase
MIDEFDKVQSALYAISPDVDRHTWVRMAMSCKAALGDAGFEVFDSWSSGGSTYDPKQARATWRSVRSAGGVGPGTLFAIAKEHGWRGEPIVYDREQEARRRAQRAAEERAEAERKAKKRAAVQALANGLVKRAAFGEHAYLAAKGFGSERGMCVSVGDGDWHRWGFRAEPPPPHPLLLMLPMRDVESNEIVSAQFIDVKGHKTFLPGGQMRGTVMRLGRGPESWLCEGYATGLSIRAALAALCRPGTVIVCWNAGNLPTVAEKIGGPRFVVADNDASGAGEQFAAKTGLPWWQPPRPDGAKTVDANDYHQTAGLRPLADALRRLMNQ